MVALIVNHIPNNVKYHIFMNEREDTIIKKTRKVDNIMYYLACFLGHHVID